MEPNKIEKHMQKVLKERKVFPSDSAWSAISKELNADKKPNNKKFYWYAIAASFLILISFSLFFYTKKDVDVINSIVIEQESREVLDKQLDSNEIIKEVEKIEVAVIPERNVKKILKQKTSSLIIASPVHQPKEQIVHNEPLLGGIKDSFIVPDSVLETKVAAIIEKTEFLKAIDYEVTDAEIDSLLRDAQLEILTNKLFVDTSKVDALALLNEVESELDKSFRDQIFKSLKSRFLKVKTAVADRNN